MPASLQPAVVAATAALEATPVSDKDARAEQWLALGRAWTEAAEGGGGGAAADGGNSANANSDIDTTECHKRAYAAFAAGLREVGAGAASAADLSTSCMTALASLAAAPPARPIAPTNATPKIERFLVLSDLHVDAPLPWRCNCFSSSSPSSQSPTGMDWVRGLAADPSGCLIVAGDCADSLAATLSCLAELRARFARVFYCPGNHDLYLRSPADAAAFPDSWCKLFALRRACARLGVETSPAAAPVAGGGTVVVAPLPSWYDDGDFCNGGNGGNGNSGINSTTLRYDAPCAWGPVRDCDVHRVFLSLARRELATATMAAAAQQPARPPLLLITATHFLPRPELPFHRGVMSPAMGCAALGSAVLPALAGVVLGGDGGDGGRKEGRHVHAYGHSHVNHDGVLDDGVRYVQRALGAGPTTSRSGNEGGALEASLCRCFLPLVVYEAPAASAPSPSQQ